MGKRAFTLIELIVVIAIIAILAAVIAPTAFVAIEKSKIAKATDDMKTLKTAAMSYYADTGTWPLIGLGGAVRSSGKGFVNNDNGTGVEVRGWDGPYLSRWPVNPWGKVGSAWGNQYYWDADFVGDDNGDGIVGEAQVIMFNVPRKSGQTLDDRYDNGVLLGADVGFVYQNTVVDGNGISDPMTLNWMIKEPLN
jgi:type II secretion system protein G